MTIERDTVPFMQQQQKNLQFMAQKKVDQFLT